MGGYMVSVLYLSVQDDLRSPDKNHVYRGSHLIPFMSLVSLGVRVQYPTVLSVTHPRVSTEENPFPDDSLVTVLRSPSSPLSDTGVSWMSYKRLLVVPVYLSVILIEDHEYLHFGNYLTSFRSGSSINSRSFYL